MVCKMGTDMAKNGMMRCLTLAAGTAFGLAVTGGQALAAGASEPGLPQLDISTWPSQIFWLIVIFGVGFVIMAKIVTPKIGTVLEDRRTRIDGDLGRAREASTEAAKIRAEYEADLEAARSEASAFTRKAEAEALETARLLEGKADKKVVSKVTSAEKKLAAAKAEAMENLNTVAAEAALEAVKGLTGLKATKAQAEKVVKTAAKAMDPQEAN